MARPSLRGILLFFLLVLLTRCAPLASVGTGTITFISAFSGSQNNVPLTVTKPISVTPLPPAAVLQAALSLMSFQSIMSVEFIFNTSVASLGTTSLQVTFSPINATYFKHLQLHYMVAQHPSIDIVRGCFYCGSTLAGTGPRGQNFTNLTTSLSASLPSSSLELTTAISGLKVSNSLGRQYSVSVEAVKGAGTAVEVRVATEEENWLEWVCVAVIVYKRFTRASEVYLRASTPVGFAGTGALQTYPSMALNANIMFFGISAFRLDLLLASEHKFMLSTSSAATPTSLATNENSVSVTLEQFFVWDAGCGASFVNTLSMDCTGTCPAGFYANAQLFCVGCPPSASHCLACGASGCTSCNEDAPVYRTLVGSSCPCQEGYFESNSSCLFCNTSFPNCEKCLNASYCYACFPPFTNSSGSCVCQSGLFLVNGACKLLAGCATMNNITTGLYCQLCSTSLNFVLAANQTCICINFTLYNPTSGKCEGVCGDGRSLDNVCDDGDGLNGNGCENNCTITPGFHCSNPNKLAPSICVPIRNFTAQYLYAVKDSAASSAFLYFSLSPDDPTLALMDFSALVQTTIPLSALETSYVSSGDGSGVLVVSVGYTETIEGTAQNMTIYFDNAFVFADVVELQIVPQGVNYQLAFNAMDSMNSMISLLAAGVGAFALLLALVSSVLGYKLIGFEVMLPLQACYFALAELSRTFTALGALRSLNYANGYNQVASFDFMEARGQGALPGLMVMERSSEFLANLNFAAVPLLVAMAVAVGMRLGIREKKAEGVRAEEKGKKGKQGKEASKLDNAETSKPGASKQSKTDKVEGEEPSSPALPQAPPPPPPPPVDKCEQAYTFLVDRVLVALWVPLLLNTVFSFSVQMLSPPPASGEFPVGMNIGAGVVFFVLAMMCVVLLVGKIYDKEFRVSFHTKSRKYPVYLIAFYMLQAVVVSSFFDAPASLYLALAASALPIVLVLRKQPHGALLSLHGLTALYCQILPPLTLTLFLLSSSLEGATSSLLALAIVAAGAVAEGLTVVRLVLVLRADWLRRKELESAVKAEKEDVELQSIAHETIKRSLPQGEPIFHWDGQGREGDGSQKRLKQIDVNSELEDEEEDDDEDELARIKQRLKKELISRRGPAA